MRYLIFSSLIFITFFSRGQGGSTNSSTVDLNYKGIFLLHNISEKFMCKEAISISTQEGIVELDMSACEEGLITSEVMRQHLYNLYWHGLSDNSSYSGIKVKDMNMEWSASQIDFAYIQPEKISIFGRDFIRVNDSTYRVERHGSVILDEFKVRYFDNCVYKTDTLNVIAMVQQWGTRWRISAPCPPYYLSKAEINMWGSDEKWDYYSMPCERNGTTKLRTIALHPNGQFKWNWGLGNMEALTAGTYQIENDSILILQTDYELMDQFISEYEELFPGRSIGPKYLIQRQYVLRDDRIYFINEYR